MVFIYDILSQLVFNTQIKDYFTKYSAERLLIVLFEVTEIKLSKYWRNLVRYGCLELIKVEVSILQADA